MNSEVLTETHRILAEPLAKQKLQENATIEKGNIMDDLINHPGWQIIETELGGRLERLQGEVERVTTLKELGRLQAEMKVVRYILNSPKAYLINRDTIFRRNK